MLTKAFDPRNIKWQYIPVVISQGRSVGYRFQNSSICQRELTLSSRATTWTLMSMFSMPWFGASHYLVLQCSQAQGLPLITSGGNFCLLFPSQLELLKSWGPCQVSLRPCHRCLAWVKSDSIRTFCFWVFSGRPWPIHLGTGILFFFYRSSTCTL